MEAWRPARGQLSGFDDLRLGDYNGIASIRSDLGLIVKVEKNKIC